jgi:hypothetical protein
MTIFCYIFYSYSRLSDGRFGYFLFQNSLKTAVFDGLGKRAGKAG